MNRSKVKSPQGTENITVNSSSKRGQLDWARSRVYKETEHIKQHVQFLKLQRSARQVRGQELTEKQKQTNKKPRNIAVSL